MSRAQVRVATIVKTLLLALWVALASPAWAGVEITFYSREMGSSFPHAFVTLKGTDEATGEAVDTALGFTAKALTPAILMGSVAGHVIVEPPAQIARSDRQFSLMLTPEQYRQVLVVVEEWRSRSQPSYNLNRRNCVHFVGELAQAAGLEVAFEQRLMKRPRSFLASVRDANAAVLRQGEEYGAVH